MGERDTLRRASFRILSWVSTLPIAGLVVGAGLSVSDTLSADALAVMAAGLGVIALMRRIWNSSIVMEKSAITVVNPLCTYVLPYESISRVASSGGTLAIITVRGDEILSTGFGGSLIDHFVGSTDRAVEKVAHRVKWASKASDNGSIEKRFTISWIADGCAVGGFICALTAGIVGG